MYIFSSLLIIALSVWLNVMWVKHPEKRKTLFLVNGGLSLGGGVIFAAVMIYVKLSFGSADDNYSTWAYDMMRGYWSVMLAVSGVLFAIVMLTAVSAWFDVNLRRGFTCTARTVVAVLSCAFVLIIGGFYSMTGENTSLPLAAYMRVMTASLSLMFRAVYLCEYRSHLLSQKSRAK